MRAAKVVLVILLGALLLVPPWQRIPKYHPEFGHVGGHPWPTTLPGGHAFLFDPPRGESEIAWARLLLEAAALAVVTVGVAHVAAAGRATQAAA